MGRVYYLGFYDTLDNIGEQRYHIAAASNKMRYIVSALEKAGYEVEIVSASGTQKTSFLKGKRFQLEQTAG